MTPLFFGHGRRRLFGVYAPPLTSVVPCRAVVLCHPWGAEYLRAHRTMRQLGAMLSEAGFHVMRFDYFGTGDSGGDMVEADLSGWVDDVVAAVREIQDTTGVAKVRMVGLRLGATLAAIAAAREPADVEALVLWDPVVSGGRYLDELLATEAWTANGFVRAPPRVARPGGGHEVLGFPLTSSLQKELKQVELTELVGELPAHLLVLSSHQLAGADALGRALHERHAGAIEIEHVPCAPAWLEDRNTGAGAIPVAVMQRIVHWMR